VHVTHIVVQGLYITWEHSFPSFLQWCACESGSNMLKWPAHIGYEINYLFPLVKELPIFEYMCVNKNSYLSISCEDGILGNLSNFYRKFCTLLKS
jgi:hypothetical protein